VPTTELANPFQSCVLEELLHDALTGGEQRVKADFEFNYGICKNI
jgi:hypothetical protein